MLRTGLNHDGNASGSVMNAAGSTEATSSAHGVQIIGTESKKNTSVLANVLQACFSIRAKPSTGRAARDAIQIDRMDIDATASAAIPPAPITSPPINIYNPSNKHGYIDYSLQTP